MSLEHCLGLPLTSSPIPTFHMPTSTGLCPSGSQMVADWPDISFTQSHDSSERIRKLLKIDHNGQQHSQMMARAHGIHSTTIPHSRFVAEGCHTVLTGSSGFQLDSAELISRTWHLDSPKHLMVAVLVQIFFYLKNLKLKKWEWGKKKESLLFLLIWLMQ